MVIIYTCIFFLGSAFASFINATVYRIEKKFKYPKILYEPSHCEKCKKQLTWIELLPIVGYLLIGGKCPQCKKNINIYYPISEFFLGVSFLLLYYNDIAWVYWIILLFLFVLDYHDITYKSIPKNLTHIFILLCVVIFPIFNLNVISMVTSISVAFFLLVLSKLMKKSFGLGDILILLGLGLIVNYKNFLILFWGGIIIALLFSVIYGITSKKKLQKIKIPMLPFFTISYVIALAYGEQLFVFLTGMYL